MRPTVSPSRLGTMILAPMVVLAMSGTALAQKDAATLDAARLRETIDGVASTVAAEYLDAGVGAQAAARVRTHFEAGRYAAVATDDELARMLTRDLFDVTHDLHLAVSVARRNSAPAAAAAPDETRDARGRRENFGVRRAETVSGNVGYLELSSFYRADEAREALAKAMRTLEHASALIIDMRANGGGAPDTVALLGGYLFADAGKPLFDIVPRTGEPREYATPAPPVEPRNGTRPLYVLTSSKTFSAGEGFAAIIQAEHRGVVVGERTAGAANPGRAYEVATGFNVTVPNGRVVIRASGGNWEGTGVMPDVPVPAATALDRALELARR